MGLVSVIHTKINGKESSVKIPDKKTVILRGTHNVSVLFAVESLLNFDMTNYYLERDKSKGYHYAVPDGECYISFGDTGRLVGLGGKVTSQGNVPKIHCVRYLRDEAGGSIRSFIISEEGDTPYQLSTNLTKYSVKLPDSSWFRLTSMVNKVIGFDFCELRARGGNKEVYFKYDDAKTISVDGCKAVFMLLAECFLTPEGYHRIMLVPEIECLEAKKQLALLDALSNVKGHALTLSTVGVSMMDVADYENMSYLSV